MIDKIWGKDKILIVEPPFYNLFGYKRYHYPITPVLVATFLEEKGYKVKVYDMDKPRLDCREYSRIECGQNYPRYEVELQNLSHPIWKELEEILRSFKPDVVGISVSVTAKNASAKIVAELTRKTLGKNVKIIAGGAHVDGMLKSYPEHDFEMQYDEIVTFIPDLINRKPNKKLLVDYENYNPDNFYSIMTSSGCPNSCTFCCNSISNKITYRNIESIEAELLEIKKNFGCGNPIYYIDECFFSNKERMAVITNISKKLGFNFKAGGRIKNLTNDTVNIFKTNGGIRMFIGVESGSQKILDKIKKNINVSEIINGAKLINYNNLPWSAFFIVGFPFETVEDINLTKGLMEKINPTFISINRFVPYPGTDIYNEYYLKSDLNFTSLFQQNIKKSYVMLTSEIEKGIEKLFEFADIYNETKIKTLK